AIQSATHRFMADREYARCGAKASAIYSFVAGLQPRRFCLSVLFFFLREEQPGDLACHGDIFALVGNELRNATGRCSPGTNRNRLSHSHSETVSFSTSA